MITTGINLHLIRILNNILYEEISCGLTEKEFYDAFSPGGKYERKPECLKDALKDIKERHLPGRNLDIKSIVKELQTLEKETAHEM